MPTLIETVKLPVKQLQKHFAWIKEDFIGFEDQDYIDCNYAIAQSLDCIGQAIYKLDVPESNYCKIVLAEYLAYIRESLEDYGWLFINNKNPSIGALKKILNRIFAEKHSVRNTPFVNTLENTLESFSKFCDAIYLDDNGDLNADTAEILLRAIKMQDSPRIKAIVVKDRSLLTRVYSLNNSIDEIGFTPLMYAAKYCHVDIIRDGLFSTLKGKKEFSIYSTNRIKDKNSHFQSYNLVMIAARWGKSDTFAYLLQNMTPRAVIESLDQIFTALIIPYCNASKEFKTIYAILKDGEKSASLEPVLESFIFSDNVNLITKLRSLHAKIVALPSPTPVDADAAECKEEAATSDSRFRLFSTTGVSNDASIDEGPRYPSRKRHCRQQG